MTRILAAGLALCFATAWMTPPAEAHHDRPGAHGKRVVIKHYRAPRPAVYGYFFGPIGGYSYTARDVINTYRDSRVRYGSVNFFRDPMVDRQSSFGPFDHGFFFDSAIAPRGGYAPYQH